MSDLTQTVPGGISYNVRGKLVNAGGRELTGEDLAKLWANPSHAAILGRMGITEGKPEPKPVAAPPSKAKKAAAKKAALAAKKAALEAQKVE